MCSSAKNNYNIEKIVKQSPVLKTKYSLLFHMVMMKVELLYGLAGLVGSLVSGHLFLLYSSSLGNGTILLSVSMLLHLLCLIFSIALLQVGYGNAAGCMIFLTSFIGVIVFRKCVSDETMILIGMLSFASGIYLMSFVTQTYLFYIARLLNLFALIPMPTIRSLVSQQVPASSCGTALTLLQMTLKLAGVAYIPTFTKIYQNSLNWLPGLVFLLSSIITVLAMIPIRYFAQKTVEIFLIDTLSHILKHALCVLLPASSAAGRLRLNNM
ncbi:hypothetical protein ATANTOWER_032955 [Ataeniobius toweri]|uniref:NADH dehydrogenase subunit 6 n=1 Tax=Ataeniobius toweri TaxID=208326 RepID=A0ABU7A3N4_9TELE|nr:hypothetical protein [Ataeniobius toweri]